MHIECDLHTGHPRGHAVACYSLIVHRFSLIAITAVAILLGTGLISSATAQEAPDNQAPQGKHGSDDVLYGNNKIAAKLVHKDWDAKDPRPTCKVFHHVFAPDGTLLTKGLGGKFGHHRGLFLGWNQTKKKDKTYDFWHLNKVMVFQGREYRGWRNSTTSASP